jgi:hypothetical protein
MQLTTPMVAVSAMFVAAGGLIHFLEWLDIYRHVPSSAPGAAVVRVGFPINAAASLLVVVALVLAFRRASRLTLAVILGALAIQAASLAALITTRVGSLFGWAEPAWTSGAEQTRAVEIAAIVALAGLAAIAHRHDRDRDLSDLAQSTGLTAKSAALAAPG